MSDPLKERVQRGAALLDEKDPGWAGEIDMTNLHMDSRHDCILGQRFSNYASGTDAFDIPDGHPFGFDIPPIGMSQKSDADIINEYRELEALWVEEIKARL